MSIKTDLDQEQKKLLIELQKEEIGSQKYNSLLETLKALKEYKKLPFSADTMLIVGANLLGLILILNFEKLNVLTSKSYNWLRRV